MNNSMVSPNLEDVNQDTTPQLRERMVKVGDIIEAIQAIRTSSHWKLLSQEVLSGVVEALYRKLKSAKDNVEMYRIQGQLIWAEKFSDLEKLERIYRAELQKLKEQLKNES